MKTYIVLCFALGAAVIHPNGFDDGDDVRNVLRNHDEQIEVFINHSQLFNPDHICWKEPDNNQFWNSPKTGRDQSLLLRKQ